jgi:hypothetical protein
LSAQSPISFELAGELVLVGQAVMLAVWIVPPGQYEPAVFLCVYVVVGWLVGRVGMHTLVGWLVGWLVGSCWSVLEGSAITKKTHGKKTKGDVAQRIG